MKSRAITVLGLLLAFSLLLAAAVSAADYEALEGVKSAQAFFDFRIGDASSAMAHMTLIHQTYKELADMKKKPAFVVVFHRPLSEAGLQGQGELLRPGPEDPGRPCQDDIGDVEGRDKIRNLPRGR
jgi:hypothetical protein